MNNKIYFLISISILLLGFVQADVPDCVEDNDYDDDNILNQDDNCKFVWNPNQLDSDGDSKGDVCDPSAFGYCGDGFCIGDEDYESCPEDCEELIIPSFCGDDTCDENENCSICSQDCGECFEEPLEQDITKKYVSHRNHFVQFCDVNWKCSGWSKCDNGFTKRQCRDTNNCEYTYNKPIERTSCDLISEVLVEEEKVNSSFILFGIMISLILIIILIISLFSLFKR